MTEQAEQKHTIEDLKIMQGLSLERKIQITQTRIIEWYQKNNGKVYVSFSGGKDSTVLLHIARAIYPDIPAVYIDTGLEFPEIKEFVRTVDNVEWVYPRMNFKQVIEKYGYPLISKEVAQRIYEARHKSDGAAAQRFDDDSAYNRKYQGRYSLSRWKWLKDSNIPISHMCCNVMKKNPAKRYERKTGRRPITATMACEGRMRQSAWLQHGCNAFDAARPISQPMSFWTEQDVLQYLVRYQVPYAKIYGEIVEDPCGNCGGVNGKLKTTGEKRTGCVFCGFGAHLEKEPNRFQRLKETHPALWQYCIGGGECQLQDGCEVIKPNKNGLGMARILKYIGVPFE